jgi:small subunit ribosomal protein S2
MINVMSNGEVRQKAEEVYQDADFKELLDCAVFYGLKRTKTHPKMRQYILATRIDFEIINLKKTLAKIKEAQEFLINKLREGGDVLFVGTQPPARNIKQVAEELGMPVVHNKWIGGLLTNFKVISQRIEFYKKLKADMQSGALDKYTKKEKVKIQKQLNKLEELFSGLENLKDLPKVIVVVDPEVHQTAIREAQRIKIPTIAFINSNGNPDLVTIPVPGNTKASVSINWFLSKIKEAIENARKIIKEESVKQDVVEEESKV